MPDVSELGRRVKAKNPGAYDDLQDDELGRKVKAKYPGSYDDFADSVGTDPPMMTAENNPVAQFLSSLRGRVTGALPTVGGTIGGLAGMGTPARIPLAAAGGAAGEAAREALTGEPLSIENIGREGAWQSGAEAAGGLIARGAGALARPVMRSALARLPKGFPNPVETMLRERIPVSSGGLAKANALRSKSSAELQGVLTKAEAGGKTFAKSDVVSGVTRLLGKRSLRSTVKPGIEAELAEFLAQHPDEITPTLLKEIKSEFQGGSAGAFSAVMKKGSDTGSAASQRFAMALRGGAQRELEKIPGVAGIEARTQGLIGTGRAIESAINSPPRLVPHTLSGLAGGAVGYGVSHNPIGAAAGIAASEALTSRNAISRYALILNSRTFQALMRQSPRLAAEFIHQATYSAEPDATAQ